MKALQFLIQSKLYIALAALALTCQSLVQFNVEFRWYPYLFVIFFATLFQYNFHRLIYLSSSKLNVVNDANRWVKQNIKIFYVIIIFSIAGFFTSFYFARLHIVLIFLPLLILGFLYSFPLFNSPAYIFRLREVPGLKIFIISIVWSASTVIPPFLLSAGDESVYKMLWTLFSRFIFVFAITIPFDIRDMEVDMKSGLKTIPILLNENSALKLSNMMLLVFMVSTVMYSVFFNQAHFISAFIISGVSTYYFINTKKIPNVLLYHNGVLDGTLILQSALILFSQFIFTNN